MDVLLLQMIQINPKPVSEWTIPSDTILLYFFEYVVKMIEVCQTSYVVIID